MHNLIKNKKGVELAFGIIIGIVILLLSVVVIVVVIKDSASKADEKAQVELCRVSNEIKIGLDKRIPDAVPGSTPRVCNTIDKTRGKSKVPSKLYPQDKKGAEAEIREMIKNCWYMWLEGSESNQFYDMPGDKTCFTCYTFQIKNGIDDVDFSSISDSMLEPYFASPDPNTGCATNIGGFLRDDCSGAINTISGWREYPSKEAVAAGKKCCISTKIPNECENKGGKCLDDGETSPIFTKDYGTKWYCPKAKQRCYVKEDHMFSYIKYITEYGRMGGDIYFPVPTEVTTNINYVPGKIYAISFISQGQECGWLCSGLKFIGYDPGGSPTVSFLKLIGVGSLAVGYAEATTPGQTDLPSFMLLSQADHAAEMDCIIE